MDMTNSFFQTWMDPEHIHLTATVNTPLGLYEWLVMPMGLKNTSAIHQCHVTSALRHLIGKICHIYLNDSMIWLQKLEEHERNIREVLKALWDAQLHVKKHTCSAPKLIS